MNWSEVDVESISFPPDFLWGAATAAHQVEGGLHNNWSVFEEFRGLEKSGEACDHWNRWKEDFEMLSELGLTTYRFSIEWSRLEPEPGKWDSAPLQASASKPLQAPASKPLQILESLDRDLEASASTEKSAIFNRE